MKRKDILEIYYVILINIRDKGLSIKEKPIIPKLGNIIPYIEEMLCKGFITNRTDRLIVTKKGYEFIENYERLLDLSKP